MVIIILILNFLMGGFFPFLVLKAASSIEDVTHKTNLYELGFLHQYDLELVVLQTVCWCIGVIGYLALYGFAIYVSLNIL